MKLANLKVHIRNAFNQIKQWGSKNNSKKSKAKKIAAAIVAAMGFVSALMTILGFVTGKDFPDFSRPTTPETTPEDSTIEDKSSKNSDTSIMDKSNKKDDTNDDERDGVNIDVNIDGTIDMNGNENNGVNIVVNPTRDDTTEADTKSPEKLTMSRSAYREGLERAIGSDMCMVADYYTDFNHDGNFEMFALVTLLEDSYVLEKGTYAHREENLSFILGQVWFVNQDGARNISITDSHDTTYEYWVAFDIFSIGEDKFFPCVKEGLFADIAYLWGVTPSGEPYQAEFSGYGSDILLNDYNEIELFYSMHDFYYDVEGWLTGRTWNPYYFYWDGTSFREYGGILISIDSLYAINGSKKLLEQVHTGLKKSFDDVQIKEIYYRENGVININYQCKQNSSDDDYRNYNATLRFEDKKLKIIPGEFDLFREGVYHPALLPHIATYPDIAFKN